MKIVRTVGELRALLNARRAAGARVAAVPTMGALHEGHLSLVREAAKHGEEVVVTIFVNPTQFGPNEDFEAYPRDLDRDVRLASEAGATLVFAPPKSEMYPAGEETRVRVPQLSSSLCGASRPGHFEGVATVVTKLFHVVGRATYCFGQKDYQQVRVIEKMARDLLFDLTIVACPTVREADGLAMSSRNAYLTGEQRQQALCISRGLQAALQAYRAGNTAVSALTGLVDQALQEAGLVRDYVELRDADTLVEVQSEVNAPAVLAVAAKLGATRLIDNVVLSAETPDVVSEESVSK